MRYHILWTVDALFAALGVVLLRRLVLRLQHHDRCPLPPGPTPLPFIGNLFDIPTGRSWLGWLSHAKRYGALTYLRMFGTHIIALNDPQAAAELFEKRSAVFSERPQLVFGGEMCGWKDTLALLSYGAKFRMYRKELHQILGTPIAISKFHKLIETETRRFLFRIVNDYNIVQDNNRNVDENRSILKHIQTSVGAIILRIVYGYTLDPNIEKHGRHDPLIALAERGVGQISMAAQPGAFLVDLLPILRYIPAWFPGAKFQQTAQHFRETVMELVEKPYIFVQNQIAIGSADPSYVSELVSKYISVNASGSLTPEQEQLIKWSASSLYTGGADTTTSAIQSFFLAVITHPHVSRRAQAEIDAVCVTENGDGVKVARLPTFQDREKLFYVNALVYEVLRWAPVAPMGIPHVNTEDVEWEGWKIPKGSLVLANIWAYSHDENVYERPAEFRPERFLSSSTLSSQYEKSLDHFSNAGMTPGSFTRHSPRLGSERDVREYIFGFGRRSCPGRELADATLFMFVAMSLATLDLSAVLNDEPSCEWTAGTITHPEPFAVLARPRSRVMEELIRSVEDEFPWTDADAEHLSHIDWKKGCNWSKT